MKRANHRWNSKGIVVNLVIWTIAFLSVPVSVAYNPFGISYAKAAIVQPVPLDIIAVTALHLLVALVLSLAFATRRLKGVIHTLETERIQADRKALHDPLTGLLNRRAFEIRLEDLSDRYNRNGTPVVAILDLDRFKPVNDLHGHAAGDATLTIIANRLTKRLNGHAEVARLGGDEFAFLFDRGVTTMQAETMLRGVVDAVAKPMDLDGPVVSIGCSIGMTIWKLGDDASLVLQRADKALYAVKRQGRGKVAWYDRSLDRMSMERARLEADLREAIANQDIEPYFQPIVSLDDNRLRCFEVLARWTHPTRGQVSPDSFVNVAEEGGLISDLGWCVFERACQAASAWPEDCRLAINVSPSQFLDRTMIETISRILKNTGFEADRLCVEITEGAVVLDFEATSAIIEELRNMGMLVALDDFGTGYSSLSSLRNLSFDILKIDRSFVTGISEDQSNQKIVRGLMALASELNISVTAEGVETQEELEFLRDVGCTFVQGYLFDRAMPAEEAQWLIGRDWTDRVGPAPDRQKMISKSA